MNWLKALSIVSLVVDIWKKVRPVKVTEADKMPSGNAVDVEITEEPMGYEYFTDKELSCRCCGEQKMSPEFMAKVAALRKQLGFPFIVTSAYRCPKYNASVSSSGVHGPHTTGRAIDISVRGLDAVRLLEAALNSHQFTGVGIQQKGEGRFIHLDDLKGPDYPRPALWSY